MAIFEEGKKKRYTPSEALGILLSKDLHNFPKCSKVPLRVRSNVNKAFLMDTFKFKLWEDIKKLYERAVPSSCKNRHMDG